jgi:hypothetical protein
VLSQPLLQLNDLQRIGGGHQHLAEQWIGVERYRRHQRIKLIGRDFGRRLLGRGCSLRWLYRYRISGHQSPMQMTAASSRTARIIMFLKLYLGFIAAVSVLLP